jgi:predicted RNA-binding protein YlxR (DUF448 family)
VGCRQVRSVSTLVRLVREQDGSIVSNRTGPGRGAWICRDANAATLSERCLGLAVNRRAFQKAFRSQVPAEAIKRLTSVLSERTQAPQDVRECMDDPDALTEVSRSRKLRSEPSRGSHEISRRD